MRYLFLLMTTLWEIVLNKDANALSEEFRGALLARSIGQPRSVCISSR
jgi:hypothetical protein